MSSSGSCFLLDILRSAVRSLSLFMCVVEHVRKCLYIKKKILGEIYIKSGYELVKIELLIKSKELRYIPVKKIYY